MLFMATPSGPAVKEQIMHGPLGLMVTPKQGNKFMPGSVWCADNGCGPKADGSPGDGYPGDEAYLHHLLQLRDAEGADPCDPDTSGCLFAAAPDVVADAAATAEKERVTRMLGWIREVTGFPAAYVAQDGIGDWPPPWDDLDVLFIGGSTSWKLGPVARALVAEARARGKWVHMGRVNTWRRLEYAHAIGCHSVDGTCLTKAPDKNLRLLLRWLARAHDQGALFGAA